MADRMNILVLSQAFPYPPHDGNRLPIYHFLRCLAPRVRYTLLTHEPAERGRWADGQQIFENWGIQVHALAERPAGRLAQAGRCLLHGRPWVNRFFSPALAEAAAQLIASKRFDLIQAEGLLSAQHLPRRPGVPSVLIARDCLSLAHRRAWRHDRRPRELMQWAKIRWMEADLYSRFGRILAISPTDADAMRRISPGAAVELLPNGVDLEAFRPAPELEEPATVAFSGAMDFAPNIDAALFLAREIWPLVRQNVPSARLLIVGRDPVMAVRELAAADPSIEVTGRVDSMRETLGRAAVIVSPLRYGTGMKNKVLEGAALGKAMVVTPVSLEDIELEPGRDLLQAEEPNDFAAAVASLLADPPRRARLGAAARAAVEAKYSWEAMAERLWKVYQDLKFEI